MTKTSKGIVWAGVVTIIVVGAIHVIEAPDSFTEAAYKGWLFLANGAGAIVAAFGIWKGKPLAWGLGLLVAVGAMGGYVASRTIGLPMLPPEPDAWFEPMGVLSLIFEAAYIVIFLQKDKR